MPEIRTVDGNTAVSHIAYAMTDAAAIYPITPSSPMAELVDEWAARGRKNLFGQTVRVIQMQSEAGAAGALHGLMQGGALGCTFTASQGLLLMIPNMYKLAGELLPAVFHVSARALSIHALSIFGDQSDVMACRSTGFGMLCSGSVQEAADMALVAHLAALEGSVPFLHFFDGFRTSHESQRISLPTQEELASLMPWAKVDAFRARAMNPEHPLQSGTAQNPDVYFQNREACNRYYRDLPAIVEGCMARVAEVTGRRYRLFDYAGAPDAERVMVIMGSGGETAEETVLHLQALGQKVGVVKVRLFRPFSREHLLKALPPTVKAIAVLDRTREPGAPGEPLYMDVCAALQGSGREVRVLGGRYGLGGKDFTPAQVKAALDNLAGAMKSPFTVGIEDDVTGLSLPLELGFDPAPAGNMTCRLYGFGSDGTVGACKRAVKLIGDHTDSHVQAFFAYDSRKSGGLTVSHLRFGPKPIHSAYLTVHADYVACHNPVYVGQYDMVSCLKEGGVFLLNCPWTAAELDARLPGRMRRELARKKARLYLLDGSGLAEACGLGQRISTIMLAAFFRLTGALPYDQAVSLMERDAETAFAKKGEDVVRRNVEAIRRAGDALMQVDVPAAWLDAPEEAASREPEDDYLHRYIRPILAQEGDSLAVSMFNPAGLVPTATSRYEKRGVAAMVPRWVAENCIQCGQCALVCPHGCIRLFATGEESVPPGLTTIPGKGRELSGKRLRVQVSPLDCTGCTNCARVCPAPGKALVMASIDTQRAEQANWAWAMSLPDYHPQRWDNVQSSQLCRALFEFSGACAGCGETPYIKLITQLFGDRMLIANATGCSSIYGGSSPTCPYAVDERGHGPAWASSLFEDNAEFGLGIHLAVKHRRQRLAEAVRTLAEEQGGDIRRACEEWLAGMENAEISRRAGEKLRALCARLSSDAAKAVLRSADLLVKKSVWIIGGDGWAYDIGFGGVDHVLAMGEDVNMLVLDTEVYSNTGGQASKATPAGAMAKFAVAGKRTARKDLGRMAMCYEHVYVAQVAMGASPAQLIRALVEAESYPGPSLVIAYAPCINHGVDLRNTQEEMRRAVESGYWTLYRRDPRKEPALIMDSKAPEGGYRAFLEGETRYAALARQSPEEAAALFRQSEADACRRREALEAMRENK
ncbi:MAG: pyruvate:ferredoxin (flavodoxin) oxidoreductase [Eubacteriales bacterium]|nr:pyruvate:ferredoxin (flavodoxin) oxidoreductase [Eubacteriales bacterium]